MKPEAAGAPSRPPALRAPNRAVAAAALLLLAALLRLAHWWAVRDEPFVAALALDAAEYDRWARELAGGDWLGSEPFFQAPLYPYLVAVVYRLGGSLDAVYLLQIAVSLATVALVGRAAARMLGARAGLAAAALAAVYLPFVFHDVQIGKESLAVALAALALERLAAGRESARLGPWLAAGAALGALALLREHALLVAPVAGLAAFARGGGWSAGSARYATLAAGVALALLPVAARNAAVGGGFLPTTWQGGANYWIGNRPEADGTYRPLVPGKQVPRLERDEARRLAELEAGRPLAGGEVSRLWFGRALGWARAEPAAFLRLQLRKLALYLSPYEWPDAVDYYWMKTRSRVLALPLVEWGSLVPLALVGAVLGWSRRRELAPALLFALAWSGAVVAFFVFARYRLPVAPALLVLAALPPLAVADALAAGERRGALAGATLVLAILALPHALGFPPRSDLVEYNLGRLAQERGDVVAARAHYERALAADPTMFLAEMNLGVLAGRAGDYAEAATRLERAVALEPRSDDAWANLGAARLARGERAAARAALERALALNAGHEAARANLRRLGAAEGAE